MKNLWKALCAAAMIGVSILPARAEEKTITMGTMSWEDLTPIKAEASIGPYSGILPSIGGWARVIGHNTIFVDDRDPLAHGFLIR